MLSLISGTSKSPMMSDGIAEFSVAGELILD